MAAVRFQETAAPFAGCFANQFGNFIYDVNTNAILRVEDALFAIVVDLVNNTRSQRKAQTMKDVVALRCAGFLQSKRPRRIVASCRDCLAMKQAESVAQVSLEVTQDCNHRCLYCPYSPADTERRDHAPAHMSWHTAKASVDWLVDHSCAVTNPALGFYGGEPLLNWVLISRCFNYAKERAPGVDFHFTLTANGTLLTRQIAQELAKHRASVMVSLDGDVRDHNAFRVLRGRRGDGHAAKLAGLRYLREAYATLAKTLVRINAVIGPWSNHDRLESFFATDPPPEIDGLDFRFSPVSHPDLAREWRPSGDLLHDSDHPSCGPMQSCESRWMESLVGDGQVDGDLHFFRRLYERDIVKLHKRSSELLGDAIGPMGMCEPSVRKMFVRVNGDILLCEKVHEKYVLGNIHDGGPQVDKCAELLEHIVGLFDRRCPDCIFCRLCSGCPATYAGQDGTITEQSVEDYCAKQRIRWAELIPLYAAALVKNPSRFDHLNPISVGNDHRGAFHDN